MRFLLVTCGLLTWFSLSLEAGERPNIILIMADDLGVEGLGCYGGKSYATPRLDQLASQGLKFEHAYAQPLCTNTRVQLMTGLYNNRNWKYFGILDPDSRTFGHYLQDAGYQTCIAGKWQLQSYDPPDYPGAHLRRDTGMRGDQAGFDSYALWHIGHTEDKGSRYARPLINRNGTFIEDTDDLYGPDLWVNFICDYVKGAKDSSKPFFIYYPMALPHWPMVPTPDSKEWADPSRRDEEDTRYFKDMVEYMDQCVGRIVDCVDEQQLTEDTLILFYSDNGTHQEITSQTEAGPVQGGKGLTTDAGTHVPLIARWPGTIQPGTNSNLVDSTDFLPTLMEAAGQPLAENANLDGISFFPQLTGQPGPTRPWVFCHYDPRPGWDKDQFDHIRFARDKRFKLYGNGELYDVSADPLEQHPVAEVDASTTATVAREKLQAVLENMPDPEPAPRDPLHFNATAQTQLVPQNSSLELVWDEGKFTEGPVVRKDGAILFSDVRQKTIFCYDPDTGKTKIFRKHSGAANGLAMTAQQELIACEGADGGNRRVSITQPSQQPKTLVDNWRGKKLNSPNDVALAPNGRIYFTDPRYGSSEGRELSFEGVYFVQDGQAHLATREVERPNGILISADGQTAYVADNNNEYGGARKLYRFAIQDDGTFSARKELFDFGMGRRGIDGMTFDAAGRIYATAGSGIDAGVYVFGPNGEQLAVISVPDLPTNCTFGGKSEQHALYITAQTKRDSDNAPFGLFRIELSPSTADEVRKE